MSEYQFYEFQALDRRLTDKEMAHIRKLSSRVELTPTQAIFVYNFGDFPAEPEDILAKYFDTMLYMANWGSRQLMFRFPKSAIDAEAIEPYCVPELITISTNSDFVILNIAFMEGEPDGLWLEGHGQLSKLVSLRDDILRGDFRTLYLVWLKAAFYYLPSPNSESDDDDFYEDEGDFAVEVDLNKPEPPVPPNLAHLSKPLQNLVEYFEVDEDFVNAAAEASLSQAEADEPVETWIRALPEEERIQFLLRVVKGEPNLDVLIMRHLRESFGEKLRSVSAQNPRSLLELKASAQKHTERREAELKRQAQLKKKARMEELAEKEASLWNDADVLIAKKNANLYDEAVKIFIDLRELAEYHQQLPSFYAKMTAISEKYPTLRALQTKMEKAKLI